MKHTHQFTRLTLALIAGALLPCTAALAAPVITVAATSAAATSESTGTPSTVNNPSYANSSTSASSLTGQAFGSGWASSTGAYAVNASASGMSSSAGTSQFRYVLTNNTGAAQFYTMSFHIYGGSIGTYLADTLTSGESLNSNYKATIKVGGDLRFNSEASITRSFAGGISFTSSGTSLGGDDTSDGVYSWGATDANLNIGVLGAGQSIEILADVAAGSLSNVGTYSYTCNGYPEYPEYPNPQLAAVIVGGGGGGSETCTDFKGRGSAFYGDPIDFGTEPTTGIAASFNASSDVPEPTSLALAGLGLGLAAWRRRTRRTRQPR